MFIRPNGKLKMLLFEKGISQRELAFSTGIDESQISKAVRYGLTTEVLREKVSQFLGMDQKEIFSWSE